MPTTASQSGDEVKVAENPTAAPTPTPTPGPVGSNDDWVTFAHDQQRTSVETLATGITPSTVSQLQLAWTYTSATSYDVAGPIAVGGVVYIADDEGNLVALDAQTGAVLWSRALGVGVKMTPVYADGTLFVGTFDDATATSTSQFMALDPASGQTRWTQTIEGGVHGSPLVANGVVYVPVSLGDPGYCHPGGILAFDEQTGALASSWETDPKDNANGGAVWSSLSYDGNRIYFGTGNTCTTSVPTSNAIVSTSPSLTQQWTYPTEPSLTDDDVGGSVLVAGGNGYVNAKNGNLYAMNLATGALEWTKALGAPDGWGGFSTPVLVNGSTLIVSGGYQADPDTSPTNGGLFYGLTTAGSVLWEIKPSAPIYQPPASTGGLVFTTLGANVDALDPASGQTVWQSPLVGVSRTSPIVVPSGLYVADLSGRLYAYKLPAQETAAQRGRHLTLPMALRRTSVNARSLVPVFCRS